jgi:tetratricopeptide (TPR) repeat protein
MAAHQVAGATGWGPAPPDEIAAVVAELEANSVDFEAAAYATIELRIHAATNAGDFAEARRLTAANEAHYAELGEQTVVHASDQGRAWMAFHEGRLDEALALAERAYSGHRALGATSYASTAGATLSDLLYHCGRLDEADAMAIEAEELGSADDVVNFAMGEGVRAKVAADRGRPEEARRFADEALRYAAMLDFPVVLGNAQLVEAQVRRAAGDDDGAIAALERAREIYAAKGVVPLLRAAERQLAKLTPR